MISSRKGLLRIAGVGVAKTTYPTGNPNFSVKQSFPAAFDEVVSDPFLMCDFFSMKSTGIESDPDKFPVAWHPHRGMDICSYMKDGVGRHGDSLGNRETFATPGMQWISVGSGIEHAESGGTPAGESMTGFQIWINVPAKHKMDDPQYGTVEPSELPLLSFEDDRVKVRVLAGDYQDVKGPFLTKQKLQMLDYMFTPNGGDLTWYHEVPLELDNCLVYVYEGNGQINGQPVNTFSVLHLDAASRDAATRHIAFTPAASGMSVMVFAGKRINEPIAWHGPFVMNTQEEIQKTITDYRHGKFPVKRSAWDYKRFAAFPKVEQEKILQREKEVLARIAATKQSANTCSTQSGKDDAKISIDKTQCL